MTDEENIDAIRARWAEVDRTAAAPLPLDAQGFPDEAALLAMGEEGLAKLMKDNAEAAMALEDALEHAEVDVKSLLGQVDRLHGALRSVYTGFGPVDAYGDVGPIDQVNLRQLRAKVAEALGPKACAQVAEEEDWPAQVR